MPIINPGSQDVEVYQALQLGFRVQKSQPMTATLDLFTVKGQCLINLLYGELTAVMAGAGTILLNEKAGSVPLMAATTIDSDAVGHIYMLGGDAGAVVNGADTPTVEVGQLAGAPLTPLIMGLGNGALAEKIIEGTETGNDATGNILWTLFYTPLEPGAFVVAA